VAWIPIIVDTNFRELGMHVADLDGINFRILLSFSNLPKEIS